MKTWLKRLVRPLVRRSLDLPAAPAGPPPFLGGSGVVGRARQLRAYQGWVFAAVNLIAHRVAGMPLRLYARGPAGAGPEIDRHPLLDLLARPNPLMTGRQFRFTLVTHLELTGMAFALMADNALGRPAELWPLSPADLIEIKAGPDTREPIAGFVFRDGQGGSVTYAPRELLYFRHPSPWSLTYGASPLEAMAHAFDIDLAVRVYQRNFFRNAARPEVVLMTDQRLTEDEARRLLTRWNQKHQGLAHVFEPTLLDAGLKAQPLAYSAKDFEFAALAGWTQDNILAAYGVPAGKLGLVKDVNRANAQGIDVTFNAECVRPRLELIEDVLGAFLLPRWGRDLVLRHDNPVPADRAQAHREAMALIDRGALTINEHRAALGRGPVAWGDSPWLPGLGGRRPESAEPADWSARAAGLARRHWPALSGRFAGWGRAKVAAALAAEPELVQALVPAGAPAAEVQRLADYFATALKQDQPLAQVLAGLATDGMA
ncbi:MAG: phage portal protein [Thermodesulfobacteriota bacterium]